MERTSRYCNGRLLTVQARQYNVSNNSGRGPCARSEVMKRDSYCMADRYTMGIATSEMTSSPKSLFFRNKAQAVATTTMVHARNDSARLFQRKWGSIRLDSRGPRPRRWGPNCHLNICHAECFWNKVALLNTHWSQKKMFTA